MKISIIAGARPNFMKIAPIVRALRDVDVRARIIHSGQHYDQQMSQTFFDELQIPEPDVNLAVGSGSHIFQIAEVMKRLEAEFTDNRPDAVLVVGDVNSTISGAVTACKLGIPVAHVEAGLRSFDRDMPEEINRLITDAVCDWLLTSEPSGDENLLREGVSPERIFQAGNVMIDTQQSFLASAQALKTAQKMGLPVRGFAVLTMHRPSNVDVREHLESILKSVQSLSERMPVIFPMHPRTKAKLEQFGLNDHPDYDGFTTVEPQGYLDMLSLIDSSRLVLTDSGGLQEETTAIRVPCLTLRENTERPVTISLGSNQLVGWKTADIDAAVAKVLDGPERIGTVPENWDGRASERIVAFLQERLRVIE